MSKDKKDMNNELSGDYDIDNFDDGFVYIPKKDYDDYGDDFNAQTGNNKKYNRINNDFLVFDEEESGDYIKYGEDLESRILREGRRRQNPQKPNRPKMPKIDLISVLDIKKYMSKNKIIAIALCAAAFLFLVLAIVFSLTKCSSEKKPNKYATTTAATTVIQTEQPTTKKVQQETAQSTTQKPSTVPASTAQATTEKVTEPITTEPVRTNPVITEPVRTEPATEPAEVTVPPTEHIEPATEPPVQTDPPQQVTEGNHEEVTVNEDE